MAEAPLRERQRTRRRATIQRAAMRLFAERGYDATTIADVAAEAEVAPRTVPTYFPTKLDLALSYSTDAARRLLVMLDGSGESEPVIALLIRFVEHELFEETDALALQRAMLATNRALRGAQSDAGVEATQRMRVKLAAELGREVDDFVVTLVGASVTGVVEALLYVDPAQQDVRASFDVAVGLLDSWVESARTARRAG
jgi:AcrR family transcriptional regulator